MIELMYSLKQEKIRSTRFLVYFCDMIRLLFAIMLFTSLSLVGQVNVRDSVSPGWMINIRTGMLFPQMDLGDAFGESYTIGVGAFYKDENNWLYGVNGDFWFGSTVYAHESILNGISNNNGNVMDHFGNFGNVLTYQRGWLIGGDFGKLFHQWGGNANSGVFMTLGGGFMQHRVRLESASRNSIVYQIEAEYQRGYDRLNLGWMSRFNIGYLNAHTGKTLNFMIAAEIMYGQTTNVRGYNWDTGMEDTGINHNLTIGLRFTWFFPIYDKNFQTFFYN